MSIIIFFFFNDTATTEIYTLSLHDALPICPFGAIEVSNNLAKIDPAKCKNCQLCVVVCPTKAIYTGLNRSEEHTSELQSRQYLVCRLLLEKKKKKIRINRRVKSEYEKRHVT